MEEERCFFTTRRFGTCCERLLQICFLEGFFPIFLIPFFAFFAFLVLKLKLNFWEEFEFLSCAGWNYGNLGFNVSKLKFWAFFFGKVRGRFCILEIFNREI
jgi:hypothetical protein